MLRKLFHILAAASVMVGCNTAHLENSGDVGWLALDFSCEDDSKAGDAGFAGYSVSIKGKAPLDYSLESTCGELPDLLELEPGEYWISVYSPGAAPAVFDTPVYSSSADFAIEAGVTSSVAMVLCNIQVTVLPSDSFSRSTVASCTVTVSDGDGAELSWTLDDVLAERSGYFIGASELHLTVEGVAKNGNILSYSDVIRDVKPSQHHRITLGEYVPTI